MTPPWNSKSACEKRMKLPNFTDAFSVQHTCPLSCCSSSFARFRKYRHSFVPAVFHLLYLPLLQSRSRPESSTLTPVWYPSLCTALFYVTTPSGAYPLMQNAVSAMKIPVCPHFSLCLAFTWTSLLSQQVGFTPSSFTRTIPSAPIEATISSPDRHPHV